MASEYQRTTIGTLIAEGALRLQTGPFGSQLHQHDYKPTGVPVIPTEGIGRGRINSEAVLPRISEAKAIELGRHRLIVGDILFARRGVQATGLSAYVDETHEGSICGTGALLLRTLSERIDPRFLSAYLATDEAYEWLRAHAVGAVMPNLNTEIISALSIPVPSISIQRRIANLIFVIDDRIDHNRALAGNLETIACALFKSWFVDFNPVRAKAAGEDPPGLVPDLATLFPDRFVDSELGEIPEGWKLVTLSQLVEVERGLSYKGAGLADRESGKPMHNLNSVLEGGGYKYTGIKFYSGEYKPRHIARAGDIVVANTEQGHKHLLIGFPAIIPASHEEGLFSHHLYRVRLLEGAGATKHWLYYALMAPEVREQIIGHANGSTVNMLKQTGLQVPLVVLPPMALCEQFDALAESFRARIENCVAESTILAELRDLLLPRLISGKLRVEDAEAALEAA